MSLSAVPFWTPIESKSFSVGRLADSYFNLGGRIAQVVTPVQVELDSKAAWKMESKTCVGCMAFKVLTMVLSLGILPLIAIIIKTVYRCTHKYHWIEGDQDHCQILRASWAWDGFAMNPRHNLQNAKELFEKNQQHRALIDALVLADQDAFEQRLSLWRNNKNIESLNRLDRADIFAFFRIPDDLIEDENTVTLVRRLLSNQISFPLTPRKRNSPTNIELPQRNKLARIAK